MKSKLFRTRYWLSLCSLAFLALPIVSADAGEMNYQGRLTDAAGNALSNGGYNISFSIYNSATGGTAVWGPFQTDGSTGNGKTELTQLVNGRFNVVLGPRDTAGRELSQQFLGGDRFLEIQLSTSPNPISPRQKLLHAPLALHADTADHATTATAVGNPGSSNVINIQNTRVGINESSPNSPFNIAGSFTDASPTSSNGTGLLSLGNQAGPQLLLDTNEIIARTRNGNQYLGADLSLNPGGTTTKIFGTQGITLEDDTTIEGDLLLEKGADNNGTVAALVIKNTGTVDSMLIDSNEIDVLGSTLFLNNNSPASVRIGNDSHTALENSSSGGSTLEIRGGTTGRMRIDGNEIDTNGTLFLNTNGARQVRVGVNGQFNVNTSGDTKWTSTIRAATNDTFAFRVEDFFGSPLIEVATSPINDDNDKFFVYGDASKNDGGISWDTFSDRRLKKDISKYKTGLEQLKKIETVNFRYKDNTELGFSSKNPQIGVIAQDLQPIFPDCVSEGKDGYLKVNASEIQWAAINAIQELAEKNESLEQKNTALTERLTALEQQLGSLVKTVDALEGSPKTKALSQTN